MATGFRAPGAAGRRRQGRGWRADPHLDRGQWAGTGSPIFALSKIRAPRVIPALERLERPLADDDYAPADSRDPQLSEVSRTLAFQRSH